MEYLQDGTWSIMNANSLIGLKGKFTPAKELIFKNRNYTTDDYYSNTYMMSFFPKYWYFLTIGSRGRGKTYSGKRFAIKFINKQRENGVSGQYRKFMWRRIVTGKQ